MLINPLIRENLINDNFFNLAMNCLWPKYILLTHSSYCNVLIIPLISANEGASNMTKVNDITLSPKILLIPTNTANAI
ncbi:hypothetical protein SLIQ_02350 [Serratia liquefaciens FK01]|nr:hypothetical protein SLIQ_02350 [Serratia liquefaciens FK01]